MVSASSACCSPAIPWTEPEQYSRPRFAADRVDTIRSGSARACLISGHHRTDKLLVCSKALALLGDH